MKEKVCSETELVIRAAQDLSEFGELVERYRGSILRQCFGRVRDWQTAEDLAQEVFIKAYLKLDQLKDPALFANWLRKIATNVCSEYIRGLPMHECSIEDIENKPAAASVPSQDIKLWLGLLPDITRRCVELYFIQQMSYKEISEELGLTAASVRSRLYRAKALLREEMVEMIPQEEKGVFTRRVIEKLEQMTSGSSIDRAEAARKLREALGKDHYGLVLARLRQEAPHWTERWTEWEKTEDIGLAVKASKKFKTPEVRDALIELMLHHDAEELRLQATNALVAQCDPAAIPYLKDALCAPENPREVVAAAKSAIRQLEMIEKAPVVELDGIKLMADVKEASNDRKARVDLLQRFTQALDDPASNVRNQAIKALVELGDKRAVPALVKLLDDQSPGIRQAVANALGVLKSSRAVPALVDALRKSQDNWFIRIAIIALGDIEDPEALPAVLAVMDRMDLGLAAERGVFEKLASKENVHLIKSFFDGKDKTLSWAYPEALAKVADEQNVPELIDLLKSGAPKRSIEKLTEALGRIGDLRALDVLTTLAFSGDLCAANALVKLGEPGMDSLKCMMISDNPKVRTASYKAISFVGGAEAIVERNDTEALELLADLSETEPNNTAKLYVKAAYRRIKRKVEEKICK